MLQQLWPTTTAAVAFRGPASSNARMYFIGCGSHVIRTWHLWPHSKNATGHGNCANTVSHQFNPFRNSTSFRLYSYFI